MPCGPSPAQSISFFKACSMEYANRIGFRLTRSSRWLILRRHVKTVTFLSIRFVFISFVPQNFCFVKRCADDSSQLEHWPRQAVEVTMCRIKHKIRAKNKYKCKFVLFSVKTKMPHHFAQYHLAARASPTRNHYAISYQKRVRDNATNPGPNPSPRSTTERPF